MTKPFLKLVISGDVTSAYDPALVYIFAYAFACSPYPQMKFLVGRKYF